MAAYSGEQRKIIRKIRTIGRRMHATPKEIKAALETGIVEANLTNPSGGDADSGGWRQERRSIYKDPTNLDASIARFFHETRAVRAKYGSSGALAAAVQRPAAQYRGRYAEHSGEAQKLLGAFGNDDAASDASSTTRTIKTSGTDNSGQRGALIAQFLGQKQPDVLDFAMGVRALQDVPGTSNTVTTPGTETAGSAAADSYTARANAIDRKHMPYLWGGGHGGKVDPYHASPLDCSGAVSAVLGIDPRVSGQFTSWGKPGQGDGKGVVVYANGHHVFMKIHGKFFGTSRANPGGGAGWFSAKNISPGYLAGFTVRHI